MYEFKKSPIFLSFFYAGFMLYLLMIFHVCCLLFYDKMFLQEGDYNVYDYFMNYKPL